MPEKLNVDGVQVDISQIFHLREDRNLEGIDAPYIMGHRDGISGRRQLTTFGNGNQREYWEALYTIEKEGVFMKGSGFPGSAR